MITGELGIKLIKFFESLHDGNLSKVGLQPKECPAGIWTIGYGHALQDKEGNWLKGKEGFAKIALLYPNWLTITEEQADAVLRADLVVYGNKVNNLDLKLTQNEFDALVSFVYNLGAGALQGSTLLKRIKTREGDIEAAFLMWVKANGKTLPGLVKRRQAEANLFLTNKLTV